MLRNKITWLGATLLALILTGYFLYPKIKSLLSPDKTIDKSIAVLRFVDVSPGKDQQYLSDGLSQELHKKIEDVKELRVIDRAISFSFKGRPEDLRALAEILGAAHILEGSVQKSGNRIHITARLTNAIDSVLLWSETYDRVIDDIFKVQDEIAGAVVKMLNATLPNNMDRPVTQKGEVYDLYLHGKYFGDKRDKKSLEQASEYYNQVLAIDSNYARAWTDLAMVYLYRVDNRDLPFEEGIKKVHEAIERALKIDPRLSDAYAAQARVSMNFEWNWNKAETAIKKALEFDSANTMALLYAGALSSYTGRFEDAIAFYKRSLAADPLRTRTHVNLSIAYYRAGLLPEAEASIKRALELNPTISIANYQLTRLLLTQGKYEDALESIQKETDEDWRLAGLPLVYIKLNRKAESDASLKELIQKLNKAQAYQIAECYAYRGESDPAFQWLERAYTQRDAGLSGMKFDPLLESLHNDARWKPFLNKMGLE